MLHSMYTDSSLLQEAEEQQDKMMDCNYSKVDIDAIVADLEIDNSNKEQMKNMLRKFENGLFGGGLGELKNCKLAFIKLKPYATLYKGRYYSYSLPKAYEYIFKKEIQRIWSTSKFSRNYHGMTIALGLNKCSEYQRRQVTYGLLLILGS